VETRHVRSSVASATRRSRPGPPASLALVRCSALVSRSLLVNILQPQTAPDTEAGSGCSDAGQEARVVLQTIIEPIVVALETDRAAGEGLPIPPPLPVPWFSPLVHDRKNEHALLFDTVDDVVRKAGYCSLAILSPEG